MHWRRELQLRQAAAARKAKKAGGQLQELTTAATILGKRGAHDRGGSDELAEIDADLRQRGAHVREGLEPEGLALLGLVGGLQGR